MDAPLPGVRLCMPSVSAGGCCEKVMLLESNTTQATAERNFTGVCPPPAWASPGIGRPECDGCRNRRHTRDRRSRFAVLPEAGTRPGQFPFHRSNTEAVL